MTGGPDHPIHRRDPGVRGALAGDGRRRARGLADPGRRRGPAQFRARPGSRRATRRSPSSRYSRSGSAPSRSRSPTSGSPAAAGPYSAPSRAGSAATKRNAESGRRISETPTTGGDILRLAFVLRPATIAEFDELHRSPTMRVAGHRVDRQAVDVRQGIAEGRRVCQHGRALEEALVSAIVDHTQDERAEHLAVWAR